MPYRLPRLHGLGAVGALLLAVGFGLFAPSAIAEQTIILYGPEELPPVFPRAVTTPADAPRAVFDQVLQPANVFIIPYYEVSTLDPTAEVGLMSVRAELGPTTAEVTFYPSDSDEPVYRVVNVPLADKEIWTANLRDQLAGQPGVRNGIVTGWVGVVAPQPVSVDSFQVFPSDAFASGENAFRFDDLCESWRVRFLTGGGFSGGTQLNFFALDPQGGDSETDPPTFEGEVYAEDGTFLNTFAIWTNENTRLTPASALVVGDTPFGTIDVHVLPPNGGFASATHDASGLFSVGLKGFCLDNVTSL